MITPCANAEHDEQRYAMLPVEEKSRRRRLLRAEPRGGTLPLSVALVGRLTLTGASQTRLEQAAGD
jgi:hypothetical protein